MATHPGQLLLLLLFGLIVASVLIGAIYLLIARGRGVPVVRGSRLIGADAPRRSTLATAGTRRRSTIAAAVGLALLLLVFAGKYLVGAFFPTGSALPDRPTGTVSKVHGASGAQLAVVRYGPSEGPALVSTHGWGADRRDWSYAH